MRKEEDRAVGEWRERYNLALHRACSCTDWRPMERLELAKGLEPPTL